MHIKGFQKLTLLDYPGKVACTIFTGGCNLRCPFCHNSSLVLRQEQQPDMDIQEILDYLKKRTGILEGVCITGGEPLLQPDLEDFIRQIKKLGYAVKLDTNGCFPEKLKHLIEEGLIDYVAMDIKNSKENYPKTVGIEDFDISGIEQSVAYLMEEHVDYEFRTTIVRELHDVADIQHLVEWISGAPRYYLQNFVDSNDLIQDGLNPVESRVLEEMQRVCKVHISNTELRGV